MDGRAQVASNSSAVIVAVWVAALLGPLMILASVLTFGQSQQTAAGSIGLILLFGGYLVSWVGYAVAGVLVIRWLARVRAAGRDSAVHRLSPGLAAASWFIPIGNLWLPFVAVTDTARASSPEPDRSSLDGRVRWWWACWLAGWLASWVGWSGSAAAMSTPGLGRAVLALFLVLSTALLIVAAWLFAGIVRQIAAWHGQPTAPYPPRAVVESNAASQSSFVRPELVSEPAPVLQASAVAGTASRPVQQAGPVPTSGTNAPDSAPPEPAEPTGSAADAHAVVDADRPSAGVMVVRLSSGALAVARHGFLQGEPDSHWSWLSVRGDRGLVENVRARGEDAWSVQIRVEPWASVGGEARDEVVVPPPMVLAGERVERAAEGTAAVLVGCQGRCWKSRGPVPARRCAASWPGGAPNTRRYSRLNWVGLS